MAHDPLPAPGTERLPSLLASRRRRELLAAAVAFAIVLSVAYGNVVFGGKSLVYSDNFNPLHGGHGPGAVPEGVWSSRNLAPWVNFHDPGGSWWQWEPAGEFLRKGLWRGELPFWDPYVGAGVPAMANLTSTFFFPPYFLLVLLGNTSFLKNVYFLGVAFTAGLATYAFLRRHELSPRASLFGGVAFMFSGAITQNIGAFLGQTLACLPIVLLATRWFFEKATWRRAGVLSTVYAATALSSFPPVLLEMFALAGFYALAHVVAWSRRSARRDRVQAAVRYAGAVGLSLGLVAFCYLPAFALLGALPQLREVYGHAAEATIPATTFYDLLSPLALGGGKVFFKPLLLRPYEFELPYVGVTCLLAILLFRRTRSLPAGQLFSLMAWTAALLSLKLLGVPPVQDVSHLPGIEMMHISAYWGTVLDFVLAVMAAVGVHSAETRGNTGQRALAVALTASVMLLGLRELVAQRGLFANPVARPWVRHWYVMWALAVFVSSLCAANAWMRSAAGRRVLGGAFGALRPVAGWALVAAVAAEGIWNTVYPRQRRWDVWRHPAPYVTALLGEREKMGRVFGAVALDANAGSAFEIFSLDSLMGFNAPRVHALYRKYVASGSDTFLRQADRIPPEGVLDAANITALAIHLARPALIQAAQARGYQPRFGDGVVNVFPRFSAPRYFFTTDYAVMSAAQTLEAVAGNTGRRVLLEETPAFPPAPTPADAPSVEVKHYGRNGYTLAVAAPTAGLVYCSESDFPGWSARVNGRRTRILRANHAFRAVEVPAGLVTVEMSYWPPGLTLGLVLTLLSVAGVLVALRTAGARGPASPNATTTHVGGS